MAAGRIDKQTGIIKDVKIISTGAAKGHGVLIDGKSLSTVKECAETYRSGLKVKLNPETFDHGDCGIAGLIPKSTYRIVDGALVGDLHLLATYAHRDYVLDLAETQPDTFGLSIDFSGEPEEINGVKFARCVEIYAVTIVDQPAANNTGLFSAIEEKPKPKSYIMNDEDKKEFTSMLAEAMRPTNERLSKMEQELAKGPAITLAEEDKEPATSGMSAIQIADERKAAGVADTETGVVVNRKIHAYRAAQGKTVTVSDMRSLLKAELAGLLSTDANSGVSHNLANKITGNPNAHAFCKRIAAAKAAGCKSEAAAIWRAKEDFPAEFNDWEKLGRPVAAAA